jgi:hypothetical protein
MLLTIITIRDLRQGASALGSHAVIRTIATIIAALAIAFVVFPTDSRADDENKEWLNAAEKGWQRY